MIVVIVFVSCYLVSRSSFSFLEKELEAAIEGVDELRLRALASDALNFVKSMIDLVFVGLLLALIVSIAFLVLEEIFSRL